jgi:hypothetical protein
MTITSPAHPATGNLDALEAFMEFPAALALLDAAGRVERANLVFLARLGDDELAEAALRALAHDPDGAWNRAHLDRVIEAEHRELFRRALAMAPLRLDSGAGGQRR